MGSPTLLVFTEICKGLQGTVRFTGPPSRDDTPFRVGLDVKGSRESLGVRSSWVSLHPRRETFWVESSRGLDPFRRLRTQLDPFKTPIVCFYCVPEGVDLVFLP